MRVHLVMKQWGIDMSMPFTSDQILNSLYPLRTAFEKALISYYKTDTSYHQHELELRFREAADSLGYQLVKKEQPATEQQATPHNQQLVTVPQDTSLAQDVFDEGRDDYVPGLSGRLR